MARKKGELTKQIKYCIIFILGSIFFFSCKKDNDIPPVFSAAGVWKGPVSIAPGATVIFVNQPDGTGKFYIYDNSTGTDTRASPFKCYGNYSIRDNIFSGNYTDLIHQVIGYAETSHTTSNSMSGEIILSTMDRLNEVSMSFEVFKQ